MTIKTTSNIDLSDVRAGDLLQLELATGETLIITAAESKPNTSFYLERQHIPEDIRQFINGEIENHLHYDRYTVGTWCEDKEWPYESLYDWLTTSFSLRVDGWRLGKHPVVSITTCLSPNASYKFKPWTTPAEVIACRPVESWIGAAEAVAIAVKSH